MTLGEFNIRALFRISRDLSVLSRARSVALSPGSRRVCAEDAEALFVGANFRRHGKLTARRNFGARRVFRLWNRQLRPAWIGLIFFASSRLPLCAVVLQSVRLNSFRCAPEEVALKGLRGRMTGWIELVNFYYLYSVEEYVFVVSVFSSVRMNSIVKNYIIGKYIFWRFKFNDSGIDETFVTKFTTVEYSYWKLW